jgi:Ser/Thr protein kinase RdoA (MazF antagonist)
MTTPPAAYAELTPQFVLDALESVGVLGDGRVLQLNSYENRVFQIFLEDGGAVVAKFYRPRRWSDLQILEEHAFATELLHAEVPVVAPQVLQSGKPGALFGLPPTLAHVVGSEQRFAVAPRCGGREIELEDLAALTQLGRFLGRLHNVGARSAFRSRVTMAPAHDAQRARRTILEGDFVPAELTAAWSQASQQAAEGLAQTCDRVAARSLRLHGDCHHGNVLWRHDGDQVGPHIVDLDDAVNGPAVQDLWMLAAGDPSTVAQQFAALLAGYEQMREFDRRELALIEPLRTLRMLRHSAWIAERWSDPAFPAAFPFFGSAAYWQQQIQQLREQTETMAEPPLRV